jgi:hypothetical protein
LYVIYATLKFIGGGENQNKEKKMSNEKKILASVFETICKQVWSDGGDGCALIYCKSKNYKEVSKDFDYYYTNWLKTYKGIVYKLTEGEDYDLWSDNSNENFFFTSNKQKVIDDINGVSDSYIITV